MIGDVAIRPEAPHDAEGVQRVNQLAFGQQDEAELVRKLHAARAVILSLVAEQDGVVVGHILLSPVRVDTPGAQLAAVGLGPMAVLPELQRRGIGRRLIEESLERLRSLGHEAVVVVGHPQYYPRFGFMRASQLGLRWEMDCPNEAFMAMELRPGALAGRAGVVRYHPEFGSL